MKKIIFLCEHPFTEHNSFKMELKTLKDKKIEIIVNDLSQIILGKDFSNHWKTKLEKKSLKFSSFIVAPAKNATPKTPNITRTLVFVKAPVTIVFISF